MKTVLVVDDHPDTNDITCRLVRRMGHQTISAATGEEALAQLATTTPDLIILDVMMPGMNGTETLRLIRANIATATVPVIMYSAVVDPEFQANVVTKGANEYLVKSGLEIADFRRIVAKYLGAPVPAEGAKDPAKAPDDKK